MAKVELDIPEDLDFIRKMPHIDWSLVIAKALQSQLEHLSRLKKIVLKSRLTEKDVDEFSDEINEALSKHYMQ